MQEKDPRRQMENENSEIRQDQMNSDYSSINDQQETSRTGNELQDEERSSERGLSSRGFAAMNPEKQKQIASEGGRAAHRQGVAHEWNSDEARRAGRKGGQIVSQNREHMSEIGRRGGQSSGGRRNRNQQNEGGMNE